MGYLFIRKNVYGDMINSSQYFVSSPTNPPFIMINLFLDVLSTSAKLARFAFLFFLW